MSADFWAGYASGSVGILIGNPLDIIKVRLQATADAPNNSLGKPSGGSKPPVSPSSSSSSQLAGLARRPVSLLIAGTAAPVLGYGALNALLFVSYNRSEAFLERHFFGAKLNDDLGDQKQKSLWSTWFAGAAGGLATWVVSTPTELIKCRAQLATSSSHSADSNASSPSSSYRIALRALRHEGGIKALYVGGVVTAIRDSVGYGFYFWSYELCGRWWDRSFPSPPSSRSNDTQGDNLAQGDGTSVSAQAKILVCGGLAGVATWASVFPLDVIKTRVQGQHIPSMLSSSPSDARIGTRPVATTRGAMEIARIAYRDQGIGVFFRGLGVCSVRAFVVNAVQWAVYEAIMARMGSPEV